MILGSQQLTAPTAALVITVSPRHAHPRGSSTILTSVRSLSLYYGCRPLMAFHLRQRTTAQTHMLTLMVSGFTLPGNFRNGSCYTTLL